MHADNPVPALDDAKTPIDWCDRVRNICMIITPGESFTDSPYVIDSDDELVCPVQPGPEVFGVEVDTKRVCTREHSITERRTAAVCAAIRRMTRIYTCADSKKVSTRHPRATPNRKPLERIRKEFAYAKRTYEAESFDRSNRVRGAIGGYVACTFCSARYPHECISARVSWTMSVRGFERNMCAADVAKCIIGAGTRFILTQSAFWPKGWQNPNRHTFSDVCHTCYAELANAVDTWSDVGGVDSRSYQRSINRHSVFPAVIGAIISEYVDCPIVHVLCACVYTKITRNSFWVFDVLN